MKKEVLALVMLAGAWLASVTALAQFDVSKVYTIESNNNAGKYMQDNGDGYIVTGALNANSYWKFETTGNDGCYYVKNAKTGKYMQKTSEYEVSVKTGDTSVEIYIKNDPDKGATVYGMASTDRTPHDFADDNTWGANYNGGTGVVQGFHAALGKRPNSFWKIIGHSFTNGICSDNCSEKYQAPALVNGWYELTNAGNVEWFSNKVNSGDIAIQGKMMNDIDFTDVNHTPIGNTTGYKFNGTFDGQGFRIKNLIISRDSEDNIGFFGFLRGAGTTTIKNLIIDATCSIHGNNRVGGIAGSFQVDGGTITIENVVNEANISANGKDAAGIIGGRESHNPTFIIKNVLNKGNVTSSDENAYVGALCCYFEANSNSKIENFVNLGTIGTHRGGNIGRHNITNITNIIDLSDTDPDGTNDGTNYGFDSGLTTDDITNGKLAYTVGWWQLLGTDAYPMPIEKAGAVVYRNGNYSCPNTVASETYSNTEYKTGNYTSHTNNTKGFCTYCDEVIPDHISADADGFLPLSSSDDLTWFSAMVNAGNTAINGKLTENVDMSSVTYTPIGNNDNRYHGAFDGANHKVNLNIDTNAYGQAFIGIATGGVTVKNLVITGTVKNAGSKTAGIIAEAIGGGLVTIQNCGNEATIQGAGGETAAIVANNWGYSCTLSIENVYNIGDVSGTGDVSSICACQGNSNSIFKNVYNAGNVTGDAAGKFVRTSSGTYANCYSTSLSNDNASIIQTDASKVASGELCAKLGFGFRQNLSSDTYPNFTSDHGFVVQIGEAKYSTMYNTYSDVTIPTGIEAFAGKVNTESISLLPITEAIAASEPVVIKGEAALYNFMPTTGASKAATNDLQGSDGTKTGGSNIYALAQKNDVVGFYPVAASVTIPAGKAYLEYTGSNSVKGFAFVFDGDDATGISLTPDPSPVGEGSIYNLAGQRIQKMQKGINIVNGKKILK